MEATTGVQLRVLEGWTTWRMKLLFNMEEFLSPGDSVIQEKKFVIVKKKIANLIRLYREIINLIPGSEMKKLRNGMLLIKVISKTYFEKLLKPSIFYGEHILVEPHRGLNSCKGYYTVKNKKLRKSCLPRG